MVIDTHWHLLDHAQLPYDWAAGHPRFGRTFSAEDYATEALAAGITHVIHVEANVAADHALAEARHVAALTLPAGLTLAGIVAAATPESPDFAAQLELLKAVPQVRGIRRVFFEPAQVRLMTDPDFARALRRLPDHGLAFDLCLLSADLPSALKLIASCPDLTFILDHAGVHVSAGGKLEPWRTVLAVIASHPNVWCKLSGLPQNTTGALEPSGLRPWVENILGCFGWDRVMFGSDYPLSTGTGTIQQLLATILQVLPEPSEAQLRALFADNAIRAYRLPKK